MDNEQIKKALNFFEDDKFTDAKDILTQVIANKRDSYLNSKLGLKESINENSTDDAEGALTAILRDTRKSKNDKAKEILKMGNSIFKYFEKNGSFTPGQAKWIYDTSKAFYGKEK
jgi:thioredoxin-like negative regulator of GroEL